MKYIDADRLWAEIERRIYEISHPLKDGYEVQSIGKIEGLSELLEVIDSLQQEQPSILSNLKEAANKFAVFYDQGTCDGIAQECFKAGAEWMIEKFMAILKEYREKGIRCMLQSEEHNEPDYQKFWDGFQNCAQNIKRELEEEHESD